MCGFHPVHFKVLNKAFAAAAMLLLILPGLAGAFDVRGDDAVFAARWNAEPFLGTGLHDGIQVAIQPGFVESFRDFTPEEVALFEEAIENSFRAWESPGLEFDIFFDGPAVEGIRLNEGLEIDLLAVPNEHRFFINNQLFGVADVKADDVVDRLLTNGRREVGNVITRVDLFINIDNVNAFAALLTPEQQLLAIQRLLMHEIGHALGLGHPNTSGNNLDTDGDPSTVIDIDPCDPLSGLTHSPNFDYNAIMSNNPVGLGFFETELQPDDISGRDVLYPPLPEGGCPPRVSIDPIPVGMRPVGVSLAENGDLYVATHSASSASTKILKITPDGAVAELAELAGVVPCGVAQACGRILAFDETSNAAFVADMLSDSVLKVNPDGTTQVVIDATGDGSGALHDLPRALLVDETGNLYVGAWASSNVFKVTPNGAISEVFEPSPSGPGQPFCRPNALAMDGQGNLFIACDGSDSVVRLDPEGNASQIIGPDGDGFEDLDRPSDLIVRGKQLIVAGGASDNVFAIDPDGRITGLAGASLLPPGVQLERPTGLAWDEIAKNFYVVASDSNNVIRIRRDGRVEELFDYADLQANDVEFLGDGNLSAVVISSLGGTAYFPFRGNSVLRLKPACGDGLDNDGDGLTDLGNDPGCPIDRFPVEDPECDDGRDNDDDGLIDLADTGCLSPIDNLETRSSCGFFGEFAALLVLILGCRVRRENR